ncbi:MAG: DUF2283 domain-containing protein [Bacteroidia bacterium]
MVINYDSKTDLLYISLNKNKSDIINRRISDDVVLDMNEDDKIVGIEIINASKNVELNALCSVEFHIKRSS